MAVYRLNPLEDPRWPELLERHPSAGAFHSRPWLEALRRAYGYEAVALTTSEPGQALKNGMVFCKVKSWLTGSRMVSLPFADHCEPLLDGPSDLSQMLESLEKETASKRWNYIELRPLTPLGEGAEAGREFGESSSFAFHCLDLRPDVDAIFRGFHKSCVQRKLQRAGREDLTLEVGRSETQLKRLYGLLLLTRRRHQLPPQPLSWFRNLTDSLGDGVKIWLAMKGAEPVAGILTIHYKKRVIYKYGASDEKFHNLGGMPFLFWSAIQESKAQGAEEFDFGRSDLDNPGLITFKDRWGAARSTLTYYRSPRPLPAASAASWQRAVAGKVFSRLPDFCLTAAGKLLYKHVG